MIDNYIHYITFSDGRVYSYYFERKKVITYYTHKGLVKHSFNSLVKAKLYLEDHSSGSENGVISEDDASSEGEASSDNYTKPEQNALTRKEINFLLKELKTRYLDCFTQRESVGDKSKACILADLNLRELDRVLVDTKTRKVNEFTNLLTKLAKHDKKCFITRNKYTCILGTSVNRVYSNLMESIKEPLRVDQINLIINISKLM
jgi:hypothetical protein